MVQESIVEYINSQMKLGVSRDTIKATLTGAGWQAADVEDTLKKVELTKVAQVSPTITTAAGVSMAATSMAAAAAAKPAMPAMGSTGGAGATNPGPQVIKMSDLVSTSPSSSSSSASMSMKSSTPKSPLTGPIPTTSAAPMTMPAGKRTADTFQATSISASKPHSSHGSLITEIVLLIIILAVGGFAGFLFMQNSNLNAQLGSLNGQSSGVNSQLSALQAQVAASTTALTAQVSTLGGANQELQTELSFLVAPTSTAGTASTTATVSGTVAAGKTGYVITATYGTKIYVANSKSPAVIAALTPLMATTPAVATSTASSTAQAAPTAASVAQFTGTYVRGSDTITLTLVNGAAVQ